MRNLKSKLIHAVCPHSKCYAMFCASSSMGVRWMNYISLVLSCKVCVAVPPVLHMSSNCVVLFLQSFTCLQIVWFCSSSPSHVFKVCDAVPPVLHMSSDCVVLFLQSFTCLQSVWSCSSSPSHVFKMCGSVPPVLHMSSKCVVFN